MVWLIVQHISYQDTPPPKKTTNKHLFQKSEDNGSSFPSKGLAIIKQVNVFSISEM